ncbi:hypothetical protein HanPSC8_Chr10g0421071 [Helianthus annuus]|nr:hypothetical protein HanPSC8_Chr10g0421071 [Helianthus annuus]
MPQSPLTLLFPLKSSPTHTHHTQPPCLFGLNGRPPPFGGGVRRRKRERRREIRERGAGEKEREEEERRRRSRRRQWQWRRWCYYSSDESTYDDDDVEDGSGFGIARSHVRFSLGFGQTWSRSERL